MTGHVFSLLDGETSVEPTLLAAATPPNGFKVIGGGQAATNGGSVKSRRLGQMFLSKEQSNAPEVQSYR